MKCWLATRWGTGEQLVGSLPWSVLRRDLVCLWVSGCVSMEGKPEARAEERTGWGLACSISCHFFPFPPSTITDTFIYLLIHYDAAFSFFSLFFFKYYFFLLSFIFWLIIFLIHYNAAFSFFHFSFSNTIFFVTLFYILINYFPSGVCIYLIILFFFWNNGFR